MVADFTAAEYRAKAHHLYAVIRQHASRAAHHQNEIRNLAALQDEYLEKAAILDGFQCGVEGCPDRYRASCRHDRAEEKR